MAGRSARSPSRPPDSHAVTALLSLKAGSADPLLFPGACSPRTSGVAGRPRHQPPLALPFPVNQPANDAPSASSIPASAACRSCARSARCCRTNRCCISPIRSTPLWREAGALRRGAHAAGLPLAGRPRLQGAGDRLQYRHRPCRADAARDAAATHHRGGARPEAARRRQPQQGGGRARHGQYAQGREVRAPAGFARRRAASSAPPASARWTQSSAATSAARRCAPARRLPAAHAGRRRRHAGTGLHPLPLPDGHAGGDDRRTHGADRYRRRGRASARAPAGRARHRRRARRGPFTRYATTKEASHLQDMVAALLHVDAQAETIVIEPAPPLDAAAHVLR